MAVEWVIFENHPISFELLTEGVEDRFENITGIAIEALKISSDTDVSRSMGEFSSSLECKIYNEVASVELDRFIYSEPEISRYGYVESARNVFSIALGIIVAMHWNIATRGQVSGPGLGGRGLRADESIYFLKNLFKKEGGHEGLRRVASFTGIIF